MDTEGISALVAAVSLAVSIVLGLVYLRDRRHAKYAIETEYCDQLLSWHGQVVESLLSLRAFSAQNTAPEMRLHLIKLSSLIEQGRFYFPNIKSDQHGLSKPPAYRGYRNIALDFLVASHKLYSKPRTDSTDRHGEFLQRMFTSVVFDVVRPTERLKRIREMTDRYFIKEASIVDLTEAQQLEAVGHMWDKN